MGKHKVGCEALVYAVVELAVQDYKKALKRCVSRERAGQCPRVKDMWLKEECEIFFMSQDFQSLTGADGFGIMCTVEDRVLQEMR